MTIAVVDDEKNLRRTVQTALEREGFSVATFADGKAALAELTQHTDGYNLCISDIIMPVMDGLALLRALREASVRIPFMFLTSKDEEFDKVLGLELGADDYLCKPFSLRELVARVHVILRRTGASMAHAQQGTPGEHNLLRVGAVTLDRDSYTAAYGGTPLALTVTEFRLLEAFMQSPGAVLTRDQLISAAYPDDTYLNDRAVDCHIKRLRKKIGAGSIETVYGLGYKLVP